MLTACVIGCGFGGGLSLEALAASNRFRLLAACDPSENARHRVRGRYEGLRLFADLEQMQNECPADVYCIASPAPTHAVLARSAMAQGPSGVLIEKPLACDAATAKALLDDIAESHLPAVVPHGMQVLPATREVRRRIRNGDIGRMETVTVYSSVDLLNAGIHWLAYLLDVFDGDPVRTCHGAFDVSGRIVNDGVQVESRGLTRIELQSGTRIELHSGAATAVCSEVLPPAERKGAVFRFSGSRGVIEFSAWAGSYWIRRAGVPGELIHRPLTGAVNYHQLILEDLAVQAGKAKPDYRTADLSLAALQLIESAYGYSKDTIWQPGLEASL